MTAQAKDLRQAELIFTTAAFCDFGLRFLYWREALTHEGFHPSPEQMWQMGMLAIPLPPLWLIPMLGVCLLAAVVGVFLNRWVRGCHVVLLAFALWVYFVDPWTTQALNRILIGVFFLYSLASNRQRSGECGQLHLYLRLTMVIIYFGAGWTKAMHGDWLKYGDCLWNIMQGYHRTDIATLLVHSTPRALWPWIQYSTLVFEIAAPLLFFWKRTRTLAVLFGLMLHLMIALTMHRVCFFSLTMLGFYPLWWGQVWEDYEWIKLKLGRVVSKDLEEGS